MNLRNYQNRASTNNMTRRLQRKSTSSFRYPRQSAVLATAITISTAFTTSTKNSCQAYVVPETIVSRNKVSLPHYSTVPQFPSSLPKRPWFTTLASASANGEIASDASNDWSAPSALYDADPSDQRYSASDWWHNMKSLPRSSILREIKGPVLTLMAWSTFISAIHQTLLLSSKTAQLAKYLCISSTPHSFLVSALGLLLVFRTNSAYQRFAVC